MPEDAAEVQRREKAARAAILKAHGTEDDEYGATLFVSHHLAEIEEAYWKKHFGVAQPEPHRVLGMLKLKSYWGEDGDDGLDLFDFTLPGDVTNYVISVHFDENGEVDAISMES